MSKKIMQITPKIMAVIAVGMTLFHFITAGIGTLPTMQQRCIHVGCVLTLIYLVHASKKEKFDVEYLIDWICAIGAIYTAIYVYFNWYDMALRIMYPTTNDMIVGVVLVFLVIDCARRRMGWALPVVASVFLLYALFGHMLPGQLGHRQYGWKNVVAQLTMGSEGIFGTVTGVSATYIFLFVLFGTLLEYSGAAKFFVDLATGALGTKRGGTAKAACVASGIFGMISGSPVANVMTIGSFTVPMMERSGYDKKFAGALLASSGSGGQFMPPIMGAAAFIIAETLGIPYIKVALAAFIPAVMYYAAIIFIINLHSVRAGITGLNKEDCPNPLPVLKNGFYLAFPLLLLIFLLAVRGWSPIRSGFWAIVASIAVSYVRKDTRMGVKKLWEAFKKGALDSLTVASTCIISGIVIGMLSLTSLGLKFSSILVSLAGGSMIVLLILAALAGIVLGMGMTTTSVYIVLAVLVAPALTQMGIQPLAAHLFVFYYGCLACITPPVASASFAAAGLTNEEPFSLGFLAWKISLSGYIIPFMFMYNSELLFQGSIFSICKAFITAMIGIYALSVSLEGYMLKKVNMLLRVALFGAALLLIDSGWITDIIGLIVVAGVYICQRRNNFSSGRPEAISA